MAALVGGAWYLRAYVYTGNPVYPFFRDWFGGAGLDEVLAPIKRPLAVNFWNLLTSIVPLTLEPHRFDSFAHQFGPVFLLFLPALFLERVPRRVLGLALLGLRVPDALPDAAAEHAVPAHRPGADVGRRGLPGEPLERAEDHPRAALMTALVADPRASRPAWRRRGRDGPWGSCSGTRVVPGVPRPLRADLPRGPLGRRAPAGGGPADRAGPSGLLHPARLHDGAGPSPPHRAGPHGESPREIVETLKKEGFTHVMLCPPVPEAAVEFDPTLGRILLAPGWPAASRSIARTWPTPTASCDGTRSTSCSIRPPAPVRARASRDERRDPTLAELRATVQKGRHREIGNWLARRWARPSAIYGTWLAVRLGLSAHQVTLAALAGEPGRQPWPSAPGLASGFVLGVVLAHLGFWLDHVDGQVARWRGTASLDGVYLDYLMHHLVNLALGFALGYGLAARTGDPAWALAGFAIAAGWCLLGLHNDCRYKAFFQRLKSSTASYRVEGGSGGKPAPPAPWPRRGLGMLTWPAYKACEPHVVLLGLTALAAAGDPEARRSGLSCWQASRPGDGARSLPSSVRPGSPGRSPGDRRRGIRPLVPARGRGFKIGSRYRRWPRARALADELPTEQILIAPIGRGETAR